MREDFIRVFRNEHRKHVGRVRSRIVVERRKSNLKLVQAPLTLEIVSVQKRDQDLRLENCIAISRGNSASNGISRSSMKTLRPADSKVRCTCFACSAAVSLR
jgi:hypothetical protein